jgi:aminopeptidase N
MRYIPIFVTLFAFCLEAFVPDPHSQSNFEQVQVSHVNLKLNVNFDQKILAGTAELHINNTNNSMMLSLDTKELLIKKVEIKEKEDWVESKFIVNEAHKFLGSKLDIQISPLCTQVRIYYETSPQAAGLQWLNKDQTGGKKMPFVYSQGEPIAARTFLPIQDSPQLRFTYDADLSVPVGMLAVMSATNPQTLSSSGIYSFTMKQPIPAYLVALAVGDLAFKQTGPRSGVYAEPYLLDDAAWEFADTEKMITSGEKLFGPYLWDRFDVVVMPPSFPIGGMENPRATFISSTTIAKDRSMVNVVAHEFMHSYFGNLVTNAVWGDLWLNEGFTVLGERWILEDIYGTEYRSIHEKLGELHLRDELEDLSAPLTCLHVDIDQMDPDEDFL